MRSASQQVPLFLVFLHHISFYISRYHFDNFLEPNPTFSGKKDFRHKFSFFNRFSQAPKPLNSQNLLSVTKIFFWFYIWVAVVWLFDFTTQISKWLDVTSCPWPWIKNLSAKTTKYILKCWERSLKRKPNLSFIRVIKFYLLINVFWIYMVR